MHFKSSEALADCTISIGAFAGGGGGGETRARPPLPPPPLLAPPVERRGFNGQIVRFVRGNRISITSQLLAFDVPIGGTLSKKDQGGGKKYREKGGASAPRHERETNLTNARSLLKLLEY